MAHAYTPGLRVTEGAVLRKRRSLPIPGRVLVAAGEAVGPDAVVARTELPGRVHQVNAANALGVPPAELPGYMRKREGEPVQAGEPLAETRPFLSWFKTQVPAPITGTVEHVSEVTGQVLLREPAQPLELKAYVAGRVVEVVPGQGVVVEARGALVQGIFGIGGETGGRLATAVAGPEAILAPEGLRPEHRDGVVVGGALVDPRCFARAREIGVRALVTGGIHDQDLRALLGFDLGVAITGTEQVGFTLIVTEGFGRIAMAERTFDLLRRQAGAWASCSGATQIRAGVIRPELIIPAAEGAEAAPAARPARQAGLAVGDPIRLIRAPHFGVLAQVVALPPDLQRIETESLVRVLVAKLPDGRHVTVPRANVEILEG